MVKSKKMSKTGIAVIVMAILLVLSMIMGLTGAWYTAESNAAGQQSTNIVLRDRWLSLTLSAANGAVQTYRKDKTTSVDPDEVMPGDYIKINSTTLTVVAAIEGSDTSVTSVAAYIFLCNADGDYVQSGTIDTTNANNTVVFTAIPLVVADEARRSSGPRRRGRPSRPRG